MSVTNYCLLSMILMVKGRIVTDNAEIICNTRWTHKKEQCYSKEVLVAMPHSANQIVVDRSDNLYFSYDSGSGEYIPAKVKIGESGVSILKGIKDAFAITYDRITGDVYFGGSHGIYKYSPDFRKLQRLAIPNLDIWWLTVKNVRTNATEQSELNFVKFPSLTAFAYQNRTVEYVTALKDTNVHQFVYDCNNTIFFINHTGLFAIASTVDKEPVLIVDKPRFFGIAVDNNQTAYVCCEDGIYTIDQTFKLFIHLNIRGVLGMTFDSANNLIYTDSHEIFRLVPIRNNNGTRNKIKFYVGASII